MEKLCWNTVEGLLRSVLERTMGRHEFDAFRLVGGTALSLQLGHRVSVDIDLFTDADYGSVNFEAIDTFFKSNYPYVKSSKGLIGPGGTFYVGENEKHAVKVDMYYEEPFIWEVIEKDNVRLASIKEINAMKLEVVSGEGRKKDFWDLHELADHFDLSAMLGFYKERYPFGHQEEHIRHKLTDFRRAEDDLDPKCLKGKHWEIIKMEIHNWSKAN